MKLDQLKNTQKKTVYMRKNGVIKVVQVNVDRRDSLPAHPMFPIERPSEDGKQ